MSRQPPILDITKELAAARVRASLPEIRAIDVRQAIDCSGSMIDNFRAGQVDRALAQMAVFAKEFDDDGSLPYGFFNSGWQTIGSGSTSIANFAPSMAYPNTPWFVGGGTCYMCAINNLLPEASGKKPKALKKSLTERVMGWLKPEVEEAVIRLSKPIYFSLLTDGHADDRAEFTEMIAGLHPQIFFQLVAIGSQIRDKDFRYEESVASNFSAVYITDPQTTSDAEFYDELFNNRFKEWASNPNL